MSSYLSYVLESSGQTQAPHGPGSRVDTASVPVNLPSRKTGKSNQPGKSCLSSLFSGFKILHTPKHIWCVKLDISCVCTAHSASWHTGWLNTHLPPLTFLPPRHQSGLSNSRCLLCLAPFAHCNASVIPTSTQFLFLLHNIPLGRHSALCLSRPPLKGI